MHDEPKLGKALKSASRKNWLSSIKDEFLTIRQNGTWEKMKDTHPPPSTTVLPTGIVLRVKRAILGKPVRYKARLAVRGNFQNDVTNYAELYAPVACIELVRLMLAVAVAKAWSVNQLDVKSAFLYATLSDTDRVWIQLPTVNGVPEANGRIAGFIKSLCGLRQPPKLWYQHLTTVLSKAGFHRARSRDCLLIGGTATALVDVIAYVDDLLVLGSRQAVMECKARLASWLAVSDLAPCSHFLARNCYSEAPWWDVSVRSRLL